MQSEIIRGVCFSIFSNLGPEAVFMYPKPVEEDEFNPDSKNISEKNYLQIAIKSISLLYGDYLFEISKEEAEKKNHFGILPYPDLRVNSLTQFKFFIVPELDVPVASTLSLLVNETAKSFIYDYYEQLQEVMECFIDLLFKELRGKLQFGENQITREELGEGFDTFLSKIENLYSVPFSPVLSDRRLNILMTGFRHTGKSAFVSILKNNYAEIIRDPTTIAAESVNSNPEKMQKIDFLWTSIVKYGLDNNEVDKLLNDKDYEIELFLSKADLIYYFIDITDPQINNNKIIIEKILKINNIAVVHVPIIIIITKVDADLQNTPEFRMKANMIENALAPVLLDYPHKFFQTSIFSKHSVLSAFSFGLMKLTPDNSSLALMLQDYAKKHHVLNVYLVNQNGLVISSYEESMTSHEFTKMTQSQIFEIISPQIVSMASFLLEGKDDKFGSPFKITLDDRYSIIAFFKSNFGLILYSTNENLNKNTDLKNDTKKFLDEVEIEIKNKETA